MTEEQLYARIGKMQLMAEDQATEYAKLLGILAGVVGGAIARSRVLVNLTARTWAVSDPGTVPATPAVVNGLPVVVVAPPEEANGRGDAVVQGEVAGAEGGRPAA